MKSPKMFLCRRLYLKSFLAFAAAWLVLQPACTAQSVALAWDPSPDTGVGQYVVHYGQGSGNYSQSQSAGLSTTLTVSGLTEGATYYFAVTAVGTNQLESEFSNEVSYSVPISGNAPPTIGSVANLSITQAEGEPGLELAAMGAGTRIWSVAAGGTAQTRTVNLSGITTGGETDQTLSVSASSSNPDVIPDPVVTYSSPGSTGSLLLEPPVGAVGSAVITVAVQDDGGGSDTTQTTFSVNVLPAANTPPSLTSVSSQTLYEDLTFGPLGVGLSDGQTLSGDLTVTASSGNPTLIADGGITVSGIGAARNISIQPQPNQHGKALITLRVTDDGGAMSHASFWANVTPVNDAPTLSAVGNQSLNGGPDSMDVTGISAGPLEPAQTLTVQATSSDATVIKHPEVVYYSPESGAFLQLTPVPGASGSAVITVSVKDDGGLANGGQDTTSRTFTVTTSPQLASLSEPSSIKATRQAALIGIPGPRLEIQSENGSVVVSWDQSSGPYSLQRSATAGEEGAWSPVEVEPVSAGGTLVKVPLQSDEPVEFFRLARQ